MQCSLYLYLVLQVLPTGHQLVPSNNMLQILKILFLTLNEYFIKKATLASRNLRIIVILFHDNCYLSS